MSKYRRTFENNSIGWGECTYSISKAEAKEWIAEYLKSDEDIAKLKNIDSDLDALKNKYDSEEVMDIYSGELDDSEDIDDMLTVAVEATRSTLEKRFNLETAQLIGSWSSDLPQSDFRYCEESLYQQDTGEFFIVGKGGAMSKYSRTFEDKSFGWGECTYSISKAEAEEWIAEYQDG